MQSDLPATTRANPQGAIQCNSTYVSICENKEMGKVQSRVISRIRIPDEPLQTIPNSIHSNERGKYESKREK